MFDRAQIMKTATGWDNNLAMSNGRSLINKLQINTQLQTPSGKSFMKVFIFLALAKERATKIEHNFTIQNKPKSLEEQGAAVG